MQAAVPVTNSSFTYTVPAMSVVTFVGQISNGPPVVNSISLAGGKAHLSVSGPTNYDYTLKTSTNLMNLAGVIDDQFAGCADNTGGYQFGDQCRTLLSPETRPLI